MSTAGILHSRSISYSVNQFYKQLNEAILLHFSAGISHINHHLTLVFLVYNQVQWLSAMLTLVLVLVQSTWMMLDVVVVRVTSITAHITPLSAVGTMRMLE